MQQPPPQADIEVARPSLGLADHNVLVIAGNDLAILHDPHLHEVVSPVAGRLSDARTALLLDLSTQVSGSRCLLSEISNLSPHSEGRLCVGTNGEVDFTATWSESDATQVHRSSADWVGHPGLDPRRPSAIEGSYQFLDKGLVWCPLLPYHHFTARRFDCGCRDGGSPEAIAEEVLPHADAGRLVFLVVCRPHPLSEGADARGEGGVLFLFPAVVEGGLRTAWVGQGRHNRVEVEPGQQVLGEVDQRRGHVAIAVLRVKTCTRSPNSAVRITDGMLNVSFESRRYFTRRMTLRSLPRVSPSRSLIQAV